MERLRKSIIIKCISTINASADINRVLLNTDAPLKMSNMIKMPTTVIKEVTNVFDNAFLILITSISIDTSES